MRFVLYFTLTLVGIMLILYLSWLPQPQLGLLWFMPNWLKSWVDAREYETIRTGVPFVFLGLFIGQMQSRKGRTLYKSFISWIGLVAVVIIAEVGQLFLPNRSFDWYDIAWGSAGAFIGMVVSTTIKYVFESCQAFIVRS